MSATLLTVALFNLIKDVEILIVRSPVDSEEYRRLYAIYHLLVAAKYLSSTGTN